MRKLYRTLAATMTLVACLLIAGCSGNSGSSSSSTAASSDAITVDALNLKVGSLSKAVKIEGKELSKSETEEVERAIRAYKPSSDGSLLVNKAKTYFYYSRLDKETQKMYDALLLVAQDPTNSRNYVRVTTKIDPRTEKFIETYLDAYRAMTFDHPEFFWLYNALETCISPQYAYESENTKNAYDVYFALDEPYKNYEKEMTAFNKAADKFLASIDLTASDVKIARQIHDKLINRISYDDKVAASDEMDLGHTAYGALVADSGGSKDTAVCDGYSLAYEYLLQQAGIECGVMAGVGGTSSTDMGGHAWSLVKLGGDWYETDSTWNDAGGLDEEIAAEKKNNPGNKDLNYIEEALSDKSFRSKYEHALYNVTTSVMNKYEPGESLYYTTKDQTRTYNLGFESFHIRAHDAPGFADSYGSLTKLAPEASGTKYANE